MFAAVSFLFPGALRIFFAAPARPSRRKGIGPGASAAVFRGGFPMRHKKRTGRAVPPATKEEAWLRAGLELLYRHGSGALTIDRVARHLRLTKGSFYHHFASRADFSRALLEFWEREMTLRVISLSEEQATATGKIRHLTQLVLELSPGVEVAVRAWALSDPLARQYVERVDCERRAYLEKLLLEHSGDRKRARVYAKLLYAIYVGSGQMLPPLAPRELREIYAALEKWTARSAGPE
jgi:AcrR family transcriptional regulator